MSEKQKDTVIEFIRNSLLSNYKISRDTGITESTIGNYKNGKTKPTKANEKILLEYFSKINNKSTKTKSNFEEIDLNNLSVLLEKIRELEDKKAELEKDIESLNRTIEILKK